MLKKLKQIQVIVGMLLTLAVCISIPVTLSGCAGSSQNKSTGEYIDDAAITGKVKSALLADPQVKGLAINVDTYRGVVQLSGFATSAAEKDRAGQLARDVDGVQSVKNDILIK